MTGDEEQTAGEWALELREFAREQFHGKDYVACLLFYKQIKNTDLLDEVDEEIIALCKKKVGAP